MNLIKFSSNKGKCMLNLHIYYEANILRKLKQTYFSAIITNFSGRVFHMVSLIARFLGPTCGQSGADRTQVGPMLAPWNFLSGIRIPIIFHGIPAYDEKVDVKNIQIYHDMRLVFIPMTPYTCILQWSHGIETPNYWPFVRVTHNHN